MSQTELRPEIHNLLGRLRRRIRRYVILEGMALVLIVMGILFWLSLGLDQVYFWISKLELPTWFRVMCDVLFVSIIVGGFAVWVLLRFVRQFRSKALALVLERRFPELDDRLITAVEAAESASQGGTALTESMLQRTIDDVARATETLEVGDVFEKKPLRRALVGALVLGASIAALWVADASAIEGWWGAFYGLDPVYRNRDTELVVKVIVQPGDLIKEFDDHLEYRHPRGGDLTLLVEVPRTNAHGKELIVPERIQLRYRLAGGRGGGRVYLQKHGDRQFKHTMTGLLDSMELWVRGGDFTNRLPYRVVVVEPPTVERIVLECDFPNYTGLDEFDENGRLLPENRIVRGAQMSLPAGTDFRMRLSANKPLIGMRIQTEMFEIRLVQGRAILTLFAPDGQSQRQLVLPDEFSRQLDSPQNSVQLRFILAPDATEQLAELAATAEAELSRKDSNEGSTAAESATKVVVAPAAIPLPPNLPMRIYLHDTDDVASVDPAKLTINAVSDLPPTVETNLRGIGTSITRKAVIPVEGTLKDDYGIVRSRFSFRLDDDKDWQEIDFQKPPLGRPKSFDLQRGKDEPFERFEVLPLDLANGRRLTITVFAQDGDTLAGSHITRGQRYTFKIVSDEEFLSILYGKELNLRERFEQIITEVQKTRQELISRRSMVQDAKTLLKNPSDGPDNSERQKKRNEIKVSIVTLADRSLHGVRKNAGETADIEEAFREILEELINNSVDPRQSRKRLEEQILKPLRGIVQDDFPSLDRTLGLFRLAAEKGEDSTTRMDESIEELSLMLERMNRALKGMQELVKIHEAVKRLKAIIDDLNSIIEDTREERKRQLLKRLKGVDTE